MATPRVSITAPPVTPRPFGLFSAAVVEDDDTPHWQLGIQYEVDHCGPAYDSTGACQPSPDFGTLSVSVDDAALAVITAAGMPEGTYTVDWGDDTEPVSGADTALDGLDHTYADPGDYTVLVTGPRGYTAVVTVTVTADTPTGPFDADVVVVKTATEGIDVVEGDPFVVLHNFSCKAPGSFDRGAERARDALRLGEQRAVETVVSRQLAATANATDLTPAGGAVHPVDGLAILEAYLGASYGGVGVVHSPVDVTTVLTTLGAVVRQGTRLETVQGTYVASGGGYDNHSPEGVAADAGEAWVYATGQVLIRRAATVDVVSQIATSPATNVFNALAERTYVVTWECVTVAVLVTTSYGTPDGGVDGGTP